MRRLARQLFRIKDLNSILAESHDPNKRLKKALGAFDLILLGIGAIIGAGFNQLGPGLQHAYTAVQAAPHILGLPVICNLPATLIVVFITIVLVIGIKESARFTGIMVLFKLIVLGFFVLVGSFYVKPQNWIPFAPNGFAGIRAGAAIVFFAYIGFDCVSTVAEETRNPKRDLPIGIIGSLAICTVIYVIVAAVFTGLVPYGLLKTSLAHQKAEPLALAMQHINLNWAAGIIAFGSIIAHTAVLLVLQLGQARIFFSMSRDELLPKVFSRVHPKFKTPHVNTIIIGAIVAVFASVTNVDEMVDLTNIGTLFAFILVCFGVIVLRIKEPLKSRTFKVPLSPITPLLGVAACVFLVTGLPAITWLRFIIWLLAGLVVYFAYSMRHSVLHTNALKHKKL